MVSTISEPCAEGMNGLRCNATGIDSTPSRACSTHNPSTVVVSTGLGSFPDMSANNNGSRPGPAPVLQRW